VTEMTTAAILWANLATRKRQATMTSSLNPLRSTRKSGHRDTWCPSLRRRNFRFRRDGVVKRASSSGKLTPSPPFSFGARIAPNPAGGHGPDREISAPRGIRSTPPGFSPAAFEAMRRHAGARLLGWMARVNERRMFEKPRGIAVSIRCCDREGRRRDYED
jgi:hypothetical protein